MLAESSESSREPNHSFNISVTSLHYFYVSYTRFEYYSDCLCILREKFAYLYLCLHAFIVPASIFNYLKQCLCLDQSTIDQVDYKQHGFVSHHSGGWKSEVGVPAWWVSGETPSLVYRLLTSHCSFTWRVERETACLASLIKAQIPWRGLYPNCLSKTSTFKCNDIGGLEFQHMTFIANSDDIWDYRTLPSWNSLFRFRDRAPSWFSSCFQWLLLSLLWGFFLHPPDL